jgi:predicted glutamine amidotransferase
MNCNTPTDVTFSFTGFAQRGGRTDHHADGWGIAFFEDRGLRHFVDHQPACESPVAELIRRYPIQSRNVIAHIRKATQGEVNLQNCHPFVRELWGRYWVFAHNGDLKDFRPAPARQLPPGGQHRQRTRLLLADAGAGQVARGRAERRGAHAHAARTGAAAREPRHLQLHALERTGAVGACLDEPLVRGAPHPFVTAQLSDEDLAIDFARHTTPTDRVAVVVTAPLTTNETWTPFAPGELHVFVDGKRSAS